MTREQAWQIYVDNVAGVLERDPDEIAPGLRFIEDLCIDSLGVMELMIDLEDGFDIEIPDELAEKVATTDDGFELVCSIIEI